MNHYGSPLKTDQFFQSYEKQQPPSLSLTFDASRYMGTQ